MKASPRSAKRLPIRQQSNNEEQQDPYRGHISEEAFCWTFQVLPPRSAEGLLKGPESDEPRLTKGPSNAPEKFNELNEDEGTKPFAIMFSQNTKGTYRPGLPFSGTVSRFENSITNNLLIFYTVLYLHY